MSGLKTAFLLGLLSALLLAAGAAFGQEQGLVIAFGSALLMNATHTIAVASQTASGALTSRQTARKASG